MGGVSPIELFPAALRSEKLVVVFDVVLGRERHQRDEFLEGGESGVAMNIAEHFELASQEEVDLAPRPGVEHTAGEIRATNGDLLRDAGAHSDQTDQMNLLETEMIEEADRILSVQCHGRGHSQIVRRITDPAIIENDHLIALRQAAREVVMIIVAERAPSAHAKNGLSLTENLVIHVVMIDASDRHDGMSRGGELRRARSYRAARPAER